MKPVIAELLVRNVQVYNSYFKQFYHADVAILNGKIYYVDTKRDTLWEAEAEIDVSGRYMVPGLIDIHMHIESSMVTPSAFCEYVAGCGVTTIVSEPHEMANVNGIQGILDMIQTGENSPIDVLYGIPSSVPSTSQELETTGGAITCQDMEKLKENPAVACVGEVMNYRQIIQENDLEISKYINKLRVSDLMFPIEGHCPALVDLDLSKFLYLGINGDHTEHSIEELRQRFAGGMFVEIQEKMLSAEVLDFIRLYNLYEHFCFVTDDVMADTLCAQGHLDALVRQSVKLGLSPEQAIYNATFTSARRMNLLDRGTLAPGKLADFVLLDDLSSFTVHSTYKNGHCVYHRDEAIAVNSQAEGFAGTYYHSIKLEPRDEECFRIPAPAGKDSVQVRVMEIADGSTKTTERIVKMPVREGFVDWKDSGCMLAVVFERYGKNGGAGYGFISGDCHKQGAVATSYAHDCHNVLVAGSNPKDMQLAVNRLIQLQGGMIVANGGKLQAELQLNIGGIISGSPVEEVGAALSRVRSAMVNQGYSHYNPIMSLCTITLPVSPSLKLTDRGLIDVTNSAVVPLFLE
ncbi:MAG: adenine deaminase C-terminal domain-containing protein [Lachnospiraceae bacterium]